MCILCNLLASNICASTFPDEDYQRGSPRTIFSMFRFFRICAQDVVRPGAVSRVCTVGGEKNITTLQCSTLTSLYFAALSHYSCLLFTFSTKALTTLGSDGPRYGLMNHKGWRALPPSTYGSAPCSNSHSAISQSCAVHA